MTSSTFHLLSRVLIPILVLQLMGFSYFVYLHTNSQKIIPIDFSTEIITLTKSDTTTGTTTGTTSGTTSGTRCSTTIAATAAAAGDANYTQPPTLNLPVPWLSAPSLPRALKRKQYNAVIDLLKTFTGLLDKANITYIMCDGTLLGSYMNHDMIPWDDDLDLMVKFGDLPKVKQIFKQKYIWDEYAIKGYHDPGREYDFHTLQKLPTDINDPLYYFVNTSGFKPKKPAKKNPKQKTNKVSGNISTKTSVKLTLYHKFKFFKKDSTKAGKQRWNWPFIDVKYFVENDTHIWNRDFPKRVRYHNRSDFYPLHQRPFGSLLLPAPHNTRSFLIKKFRTFLCKKSSWNHIKEDMAKKKLVPCTQLARYYPFVWREKSDRGVLETVKVDNKVIRRIEVPEIFSPSKPFAL